MYSEATLTSHLFTPVAFNRQQLSLVDILFYFKVSKCSSSSAPTYLTDCLTFAYRFRLKKGFQRQNDRIPLAVQY